MEGSIPVRRKSKGKGLKEQSKGRYGWRVSLFVCVCVCPRESERQRYLGTLGSNEGSSMIKSAFLKNPFGCYVENGLGKGQDWKQKWRGAAAAVQADPGRGGGGGNSCQMYLVGTIYGTC